MGLAELEPMISDSTEEIPDPLQSLAFRWIADLVYVHLLKQSEPVAGRDLLPLVHNAMSIGPKALKLALEHDPRLRREGRRWVAQPPELDSKRPLERSIITLIEAAGQPLPVEGLGRQLATAYPREEEALMDLVARMVKGRGDFFAVGDEMLGLTSWLLDPSAGTAEDVEFENFEDTGEIHVIRPLDAAIDWTSTTLQDGAIRILDQYNQPISNRALQFYLWRAKPQRFNASQLFRVFYDRSDTRLISPAHWIGPKTLSALRELLDHLEQTAEVELTNDDVPKPVTVEPEDIEVFAEHLTATPTRIAELLTIQFPDLRSDDPNYPTTLNSLDKIVRSDNRFMWVGWDRWATPQDVPKDAMQYPQALEPVVVDIEISAGQKEDVELEDEGLEGNLVRDLQNPIVKYGGSVQKAEDGMLRCTLTYGHRLAGTLPVGDDAALFPRQPDFLLAETTDEVGEERTHWVNNELRLMYNLGEWFNEVNLPATGGIFTLTPQSGPGDYLLAYAGETDPLTFREENRIKDLLALRERSVAQQTSTREIIQEIMSHHSKGLSLPELYAEVIVARMTSPRMVASILSAYYEFYPKGNLWLFNERDAEKGFKKQKKKYLRRR